MKKTKKLITAFGMIAGVCVVPLLAISTSCSCSGAKPNPTVEPFDLSKLTDELLVVSKNDNNFVCEESAPTQAEYENFTDQIKNNIVADIFHNSEIERSEISKSIIVESTPFGSTSLIDWIRGEEKPISVKISSLDEKVLVGKSKFDFDVLPLTESFNADQCFESKDDVLLLKSGIIFTAAHNVLRLPDQSVVAYNRTDGNTFKSLESNDTMTEFRGPAKLPTNPITLGSDTYDGTKFQKVEYFHIENILKIETNAFRSINASLVEIYEGLEVVEPNAFVTSKKISEIHCSGMTPIFEIKDKYSPGSSSASGQILSWVDKSNAQEIFSGLGRGTVDISDKEISMGEDKKLKAGSFNDHHADTITEIRFEDTLNEASLETGYFSNNEFIESIDFNKIKLDQKNIISNCSNLSEMIWTAIPSISVGADDKLFSGLPENGKIKVSGTTEDKNDFLVALKSHGLPSGWTIE